jgi:hypothetical protein
VNDQAKLKNVLRSLAGAALGGALGYLGFIWAAQYGFYAMVLPGALLGVGSGWLGGDRSKVRAVVCVALALGLGLFCEWRARPFIKDPGLAYFLAHIPNLQPVTLLMIILGAAFGGWFGLGRGR